MGNQIVTNSPGKRERKFFVALLVIGLVLRGAAVLIVPVLILMDVIHIDAGPQP